MKNKNKNLYELIFFVTSHCNSRCQHCFNWKNLNNKQDLNLEKIEEISKKLPNIENLLLSGGEPFLRQDLVELIKIFKTNNNIKSVSIPSNGISKDLIVDSLKKISSINNIKISVNFSIDGLEKTHNKIRGIENNFKKTFDTINKIEQLKNEGADIVIQINSVITNENKDQLLELNNLISKDHKISGHFFEIIRPFGPEKANSLQIEYTFFKKLLLQQYNLLKNDQKKESKLKKSLRKIFFLGHQEIIYRIQYNNYFQKKPWPMACSAGKNIIVLNDDGTISPCELRAEKYNLDNWKNFEEFKQSKEYKKNIKNIKNEKCFCTHSCFIDASEKYNKLFSYPAILYFGLINYFKYEIIRHNSNL